MLRFGEEPGIAALTSVGMKMEDAQKEALPNTSPSGSAKFFRTAKRTNGPKGYIHSVRVPHAMKCPHPTRRSGNPTHAPGSAHSEAPKAPPKSNTGKDDQRVKFRRCPDLTFSSLNRGI